MVIAREKHHLSKSNTYNEIDNINIATLTKENET